MTREIQSRAWDPLSQKMIYDLSVFDSGLDECGCLTIGDYQENGDYYELELLQYTGIKDVNGKNIYDGDIVNIKTVYNEVELTHMCKVVFERGAFILGANTLSDSYITFIETEGRWDLELLGNIYENPEQLKIVEMKKK